MILVRIRGISSGTTSSVLHSGYSRSHFSGYTSAKKRIDFLLDRVNSILPENRGKMTALSIGPRYESELYGLIGLGFRRKNIKAVDTFSYSPKIQVGNVHNLSFHSESFDLIVCGWTIAYSENPMEAIKEIVRVTKPLGKIVLTWDLLKPIQYSNLDTLALYNKRDIDDSKSILSSYSLADLVFGLPVKIYRLEVGKLKFNSNFEFVTVILEKV
jgi:SAM-dependent methyltransferase